MSDFRDKLGEQVRLAWIEWAKTQPDPKPSWLVPYADLAECDKEADRQIGQHIYIQTLHESINKKRQSLIHKKTLTKLVLAEEIQLEIYQDLYFKALAKLWPKHDDREQIDALVKRLSGQ